MVDDENAVFLIQPFVALKHCHWWSGALERNYSKWSIERVSYMNQSHILQGMILTGMCGNVMVTSSPFPTCNSPSQDVSMDAGLKSSVEDSVWQFICVYNNKVHAYFYC